MWLKANGIDGFLSDPKWQAVYDALPESRRQNFERGAAHRLHVELDKCHGLCHFRKHEVRDVVTSALQYFDGNRWFVGDLVVMPNHIHGLFQPVSSHELENILASIKGFVSTQLTKQGVKSGRLWQQENYDRLVRDREELGVWRRYIQRNPEKAGVDKGEYTYRRCDWLDAA